MTDLRKAAEMALAKLDHLWEIAVDERMDTDVLPEIKALRQALEKNERVNEITRQFVGVNEDGSERWVETEYRTVIRSEWSGLTEDETDGLIHSATYMDETDLWHLVSLVEERLKEKNGG